MENGIDVNANGIALAYCDTNARTPTHPLATTEMIDVSPPLPRTTVTVTRTTPKITLPWDMTAEEQCRVCGKPQPDLYNLFGIDTNEGLTTDGGGDDNKDISNADADDVASTPAINNSDTINNNSISNNSNNNVNCKNNDNIIVNNNNDDNNNAAVNVNCNNDHHHDDVAINAGGHNSRDDRPLLATHREHNAKMEAVVQEMKVWQLRIKPNDGLSQRICSKCIAQFCMIGKFRRKCLRVQIRLRAMHEEHRLEEQQLLRQHDDKDTLNIPPVLDIGNDLINDNYGQPLSEVELFETTNWNADTTQNDTLSSGLLATDDPVKISTSVQKEEKEEEENGDNDDNKGEDTSDNNMEQRKSPLLKIKVLEKPSANNEKEEEEEDGDDCSHSDIIVAMKASLTEESLLATDKGSQMTQTVITDIDVDVVADMEGITLPGATLSGDNNSHAAAVVLQQQQQQDVNESTSTIEIISIEKLGRIDLVTWSPSNHCTGIMSTVTSNVTLSASNKVRTHEFKRSSSSPHARECDKSGEERSNVTTEDDDNVSSAFNVETTLPCYVPGRCKGRRNVKGQKKNLESDNETESSSKLRNDNEATKEEDALILTAKDLVTNQTMPIEEELQTDESSEANKEENNDVVIGIKNQNINKIREPQEGYTDENSKEDEVNPRKEANYCKTDIKIIFKECCSEFQVISDVAEVNGCCQRDESEEKVEEETEKIAFDRERTKEENRKQSAAANNEKSVNVVYFVEPEETINSLESSFVKEDATSEKGATFVTMENTIITTTTTTEQHSIDKMIAASSQWKEEEEESHNVDDPQIKEKSASMISECSVRLRRMNPYEWSMSHNNDDDDDNDDNDDVAVTAAAEEETQIPTTSIINTSDTMIVVDVVRKKRTKKVTAEGRNALRQEIPPPPKRRRTMKAASATDVTAGARDALPPRRKARRRKNVVIRKRRRRCGVATLAKAKHNLLLSAEEQKTLTIDLNNLEDNVGDHVESQPQQQQQQQQQQSNALQLQSQHENVNNNGLDSIEATEPSTEGDGDVLRSAVLPAVGSPIGKRVRKTDVFIASLLKLQKKKATATTTRKNTRGKVCTKEQIVGITNDVDACNASRPAPNPTLDGLIVRVPLSAFTDEFRRMHFRTNQGYSRGRGRKRRNLTRSAAVVCESKRSENDGDINIKHLRTRGTRRGRGRGHCCENESTRGRRRSKCGGRRLKRKNVVAHFIEAHEVERPASYDFDENFWKSASAVNSDFAGALNIIDREPRMSNVDQKDLPRSSCNDSDHSDFYGFSQGSGSERSSDAMKSSSLLFDARDCVNEAAALDVAAPAAVIAERRKTADMSSSSVGVGDVETALNGLLHDLHDSENMFTGETLATLDSDHFHGNGFCAPISDHTEGVCSTLLQHENNIAMNAAHVPSSTFASQFANYIEHLTEDSIQSELIGFQNDIPCFENIELNALHNNNSLSGSSIVDPVTRCRHPHMTSNDELAPMTVTVANGVTQHQPATRGRPTAVSLPAGGDYSTFNSWPMRTQAPMQMEQQMDFISNSTDIHQSNLISTTTMSVSPDLILSDVDSTYHAPGRSLLAQTRSPSTTTTMGTTNSSTMIGTDAAESATTIVDATEKNYMNDGGSQQQPVMIVIPQEYVKQQLPIINSISAVEMNSPGIGSKTSRNFAGDVRMKVNLTCRFCLKRPKFTNNLDYSNHIIAAHPGENPYNCPHCPLFFSRRMQRQQHIAEMHDTNRFLCAQCGQTFCTQRSLDLHLQRFHAPDMLHHIVEDVSCPKDRSKIVGRKSRRIQTSLQTTSPSPPSTTTTTTAITARVDHDSSCHLQKQLSHRKNGRQQATDTAIVNALKCDEGDKVGGAKTTPQMRPPHRILGCPDCDDSFAESVASTAASREFNATSAMPSPEQTEPDSTSTSSATVALRQFRKHGSLYRSSSGIASLRRRHETTIATTTTTTTPAAVAAAAMVHASYNGIT